MNIDFTRIKNDTNGNPRYVCHFLNLINSREELPVSNKYEIALKRARQFGGVNSTINNMAGELFSNPITCANCVIV